MEKKKSFSGGINSIIRTQEEEVRELKTVNTQKENETTFAFSSVRIDSSLKRNFKIYLAKQGISVHEFFSKKVDELIENKDSVKIESAQVNEGSNYVFRMYEDTKTKLNVFCLEKDIKLKDAYIYMMQQVTGK